MPIDDFTATVQRGRLCS